MASPSSPVLRAMFVSGSGGGCDEDAGGGLGGVGDGSNDCSEAGHQQLHLGGEMGACGVGEDRGDGDADEGMESVPDEIEARDLVCEELAGEEDGADRDDPGVLEGFKSGRKRDPVQAGENSEGKDCAVEVQAGGEADCDDRSGDGTRGGGKAGHGRKGSTAGAGRRL